MGGLDLENENSDQDVYSSDSDACDPDELDKLFINSEHILEKAVSNNKYILHIGATGETEPNIALATSDHVCEVFKLSNNQVAKITSFTEHTDKIIDCRFSTKDSNLLYTGSSDGSIRLWDIRTPKKSVQNFIEDSVEDGKYKPFSCFDVSSNDRLLSVGTDLYQGDAFILFWDARKVKYLGGYWESHTDDITQVKFHPDDLNKLISGSTDGLINVYDLQQTSEDDALIDSLNTESSIEELLWFNEEQKDSISCITHTSDLQLWRLDAAEPYKRFTRADIAKEMKKKTEDHIYLINNHKGKSGLLLLVGSNFKNGECLRGFQIKNGTVEPAVSFKENKQRVRSSWYNENNGILLTGGEKGILNIWKVKPVRNSSIFKKY